MRAVVTRVTSASVRIDGEVKGKIGAGFLVLLGVSTHDTEAEALKLADKVCGLRVFEDVNGKMNLNLEAAGGALLVVSQFTLYADTRKGNRPSFIEAARPEQAEPLYASLVAQLRQTLGETRVGTGVFGADMKVRLLNDGPVTVELRTENSFAASS